MLKISVAAVLIFPVSQYESGERSAARVPMIGIGA
jgi:hypothetical protein